MKGKSSQLASLNAGGKGSKVTSKENSKHISSNKESEKSKIITPDQHSEASIRFKPGQENKNSTQPVHDITDANLIHQSSTSNKEGNNSGISTTNKRSVIKLPHSSIRTSSQNDKTISTDMLNNSKKSSNVHFTSKHSHANLTKETQIITQIKEKEVLDEDSNQEDMIQTFERMNSSSNQVLIESMGEQ